MARTVRIEYEGAVYHVMCRGDRGESVFPSKGDREMFLDTLAEACERTGFEIHSYVLMTNHYHLLLETPEANLVDGMRWFQSVYTQRANRRRGESGHLFQGRYKAVPVEAEDAGSFLRVSDYIHLNPARAGLLAAQGPELGAYRWSSYPAFAQSRRLPDWLRRDRVFGCCGLLDEKAGSRRRYAGMMAERVRECLEERGSGRESQEWAGLKRGWYVGSEEFRDQLLDWADKKASGRKRSSYRNDGLRRHDERAAERRLGQACEALGVTLPELRAFRQSDARKQAAAWWVKTGSVVGDEWVGRMLEMGSRANISRAVQAYRRPADRARKTFKNKMTKCSD